MKEGVEKVKKRQRETDPRGKKMEDELGENPWALYAASAGIF